MNQIGHMRTNKNCPKYGEDEPSEIDSAFVRSQLPDGVNRQQLKVLNKKTNSTLSNEMAEMAPESLEKEKMEMDVKVQSLKFKCGSADKPSEAMFPPYPTFDKTMFRSTILEAKQSGKNLVIPTKMTPENVLPDTPKPTVRILPPQGVVLLRGCVETIFASRTRVCGTACLGFPHRVPGLGVDPGGPPCVAEYPRGPVVGISPTSPADFSTLCLLSLPAAVSSVLATATAPAAVSQDPVPPAAVFAIDLRKMATNAEGGRNFARRDQLLKIQSQIQKLWDEEKIFEATSLSKPPEPGEKFFGKSTSEMGDTTWPSSCSAIL
ncbi:Transcription initiation factor TFIID subunit 1 [Platanthera guangdongensis]|uniref:Transcription initiation factor TFIID subunit 1 n=1 Tax=Platanthera guangdongensis TaxID=2320717 RepID=A0ABR2LXW0_9ASPA